MKYTVPARPPSSVCCAIEHLSWLHCNTKFTSLCESNWEVLRSLSNFQETCRFTILPSFAPAIDGPMLTFYLLPFFRLNLFLKDVCREME